MGSSQWYFKRCLKSSKSKIPYPPISLECDGFSCTPFFNRSLSSYTGQSPPLLATGFSPTVFALGPGMKGDPLITLSFFQRSSLCLCWVTSPELLPLQSPETLCEHFELLSY